MRKVHPFNPGSYTDIWDRPESHEVWAKLNDDTWKTKMKTASALGRPALEAVAEDLLATFRDQFDDDYPYKDRFKQMVGFMVRQVMEAEGFEWVRDNIPLPGVPFSRASRYRAKDADDLFIWRHSTNPRFVAVTLDRAGTKLPKKAKGSWTFWRLVDGTLPHRKMRLYLGAGVRDITGALKALKEEGAYTELTTRLLRVP
jgi:hypothetical protein